MVFTKEEAKKGIGDLVNRFRVKIDFYKSDGYKEAQLEDTFLKPLLIFLNWNVLGEGIHSPADREVIVQAKGKGGKEPDYLLQIDGKSYFYIEAKHPKYKLWKEVEYIWQAYRYAYSTQSSSQKKKVDFSLLTDFEEFRFFDCTFKPTKKPDVLNNFVSIDWKYQDYIDKFNDLWDLFEKNQVKKGSLESLYLDEKKIKENRIPPDKAFLNDLDDSKKGWRIQLAKDIHKFNPALDADYITTVVQLVLDRFIFIKVLSDREIEDDYLSQIISEIDKATIKSEKGLLNQTCQQLFEKLDKTYNGSIFQYREELDKVFISNKTLVKILKEFHPKSSRYDFKQIPVEILGKIYEQFLGKVVVLKNTRTAIEEKPEVRKAGGVYYTPHYIVDYIIENTVGEKLKKCKSIADIFKIKICDPACGSGSFLLGAYDKLIQWGVRFYEKTIKPDKQLTKEQTKNIYLSSEGEIRLTSHLKREILRNCIFGVDIDHQAVELAKTSLSLKMLEGSRHDELYEEVTLFHEQVLPNLDDNIKCGNSLIGTDFYKGKNLSLFDVKEKIKINVFDWDEPDGFPEIMKAGGFDCVIGNPPWGAEFSHDIKKYLAQAHSSKLPSKVKDSYLYFVLDALSKRTRANGIFSFIIPNTWLLINSTSDFRKYILEHEIININDYGDGVFDGVTTESSVLVLKNTLKRNNVCKVKRWKKGILVLEKEVNKAIWSKNELNRIILEQDEDKDKIVEKMRKSGNLFSECCEIIWGIKPYQVGYGTPPQTKAVLNKRLYHSSKKIDENWKPLLVGSNIDRYLIIFQKKPIEYIKYGKWLMYPSSEEKMLKPKILLRQTSSDLKAVYDSSEYYCQNSVFIITSSEYNLKFLLGLLNSKLLSFIYKLQNPQVGKVFPEIKPKVIKSLLIRKVDKNIKNQHDQMVSLVDQMLSTQKKLHETNSPLEKKQYQKEVNILDKQIDNLVYELYELTPEEIKIVEGSA